MNRSIEGAVTAICEDEAWQGSLTDDERRQCLEWVEKRLGEALRRETVLVRGVLRSLSHLMAREPIDRCDVLRVMLGM